MKERIEEIMRMKGVKATEFAKTVDIKQASLSHILNGRNNPSLDVVMKICQAYPDISLRWLLYGQGEMTTLDTIMNEQEDINQENPSGRQAESPSLFNFEATAPHQTAAAAMQVKEEIRYIEKPPRKVIEVRIFFDDGTYETLMPSK